MDHVNKGVEVVSEFFQGNPFTTPVGQRIEQATDATLASENWGLNMEICDIINETEEGPRDAVRAIRKRLQQFMGKNHTIVMYTLTVLETSVKNCGRRLHVLVAQKEFINELVKLIGPKFDPPQVIQEKVLGLIQSWADAFRNSPELNGIQEVYQELKAKGVDFPMTDLDQMAPIITPAKSLSAASSVHLHADPLPTVAGATSPGGAEHPSPGHPASPVPAAGRPQSAQPVPPPAAVSRPPGDTAPPQPQVMEPIMPTPEQLAKLRSELDIVQGNLRVLREMLSELAPGKEGEEDYQLLKDLYTTCKSMQERVLFLLQVCANDEVTNELLLLNDEMNNVFEKYDRYMKGRLGSTAAPQGGPPSRNPVNAAPSDAAAPLIDLGGEPAGTSAAVDGLTSGAQKLSLSNQPKAPATGGADFDMFAQSRNTTFEQAKNSGSTYDDNTHLDQGASLGAAVQSKGNLGTELPSNEQDIKELEGWLATNPNAAKPSSTGQTAGSGATSQEFDSFLAQRAAAGEQLPTVPQVTAAQGGATPRHVMNKDEEEQKLFAL